MIAFTARDGRRMFAFAPATDPDTVLAELVWAYVGGQVVCGQHCPCPDGYCVDCHSVAASARSTLEAR